jgi:hypothetical protein
MATTTRLHEGRWRTLPNLAAEIKGSIHDDERARALGFRGGFVPGPTVAEALLPAIVGCFGARWFEGGWYDIKFVSPVYVDDEVREVADRGADDGQVFLGIETRDGRIPCRGQAGLGTTPPWDASLDGAREAAVAFPHFALGRRFEPREVTIAEEDYARTARSAGHDIPWFFGPSPWGGPIAPPAALFRAGGQVRSDMAPGEGVTPPGINADFQIVMKRPAPAGRAYLVSGALVDKGVSGRTHFWTTEFAIRDRDGAEYAVGRQKVKYFARPDGLK